MSLVPSAKGIGAAIAKELTGPLEEAANQAGDKVSKTLSEKLKGVGKNLTDTGKKLSVGLTLPLVALGGVATNAASDLNESLSKVSVVFGENAKAIDSWAKGAAESMGLSRQAALEASGTLGNLFGALQLPAKASLDMSKNIVGLAADLGSFNNLPTDQVLEKLRAGLVGEAEPLRALGVNINAATVEAKAMKLGLAATSKELTEADKVQARYALILEQTATAQGDFSRTSDGLANSTKIAKAQADDAAASFGAALQPIMQRAAVIVGGLAEKFAALSPGMQTTILIVAGLLAAVGPLVTLVGALSTALAFLAANPIVLIIAAVAALAVGLVILYQKCDGFRQIVDTTFNWIKNNWPLLLGIITGPIGLAVVAIVKHWDTIKNTFTAVKDWIAGRVSEIVGIFTGLPGRLASAASGLWDFFYNGFKEAYNKVARFIRSLDFTIDVPDILPGPDKYTIGFPDLPLLDTGGLIRGPGIFAAGPVEELVVPLAAADRRQWAAGPPAATPSPAAKPAAPIVGGDLVLNGADMTPADLAQELYWLRLSKGA